MNFYGFYGGPGLPPSPFVIDNSLIVPQSNSFGFNYPMMVPGGFTGAGTVNFDELYIKGVKVEISDSNVTVLPNFSALQNIITRPKLVFTEGYFNVNDGGAGPPWVWLSGSVLPVDNIMVMSPTSGEPGRYARLLMYGFISPKWGGCGLGNADDSAQFQKVVNNYLGLPVYGDAATYPLKDIILSNLTLGPGIYSYGKTIFVPAPGSTTSTQMFTVQSTKTDGYYFRNLKVVLPVSTNPVVQPTYNRAFYWSGSNNNAEVTDCSITGGTFGIVANGTHQNANFSRNFFTGQFSDSISGPDAPDGCFIDDNTIIDSGYATGGLQPGGAIRIGSSTQIAPGKQTSISRNHIARCSVNANQDAIDATSGGGYSFAIELNLIELCGSGIELKRTTPSGSYVGPDIYEGHRVNDNTIILRHDASSTIGVSLNLSGTAPPSGKAAKIVVGSNLIYCLSPAQNTGIYAFTLTGYNDVDYKDNTVIDVGQGIQIAATGVVGTTGYRCQIIGANKWDCVYTCISKGSGTNVDVTIKDGVFKSRINTCIGLASGPVVNLLIDDIVAWGVNVAAIEMRDVTNATVRNSLLIGGVNSILSQVTGPTKALIEENEFYVTWDMQPAISGVVTNPGSGLTDGTRLFTVTNGTLTTGSQPTQFSCVVSGGVITGPVVIVRSGGYSVFPTVPTVTVDSGVVGGATFTLAAPSNGTALNMTSGTGIVVQNNSTNVAAGQRTIGGAGTWLAARNCRGTISADPTGTYAGSVGDYFLNSAPGTAGIIEWWCIGGNIGTIWRQNPPTSNSIVPVVLSVPVNLNNTANYFNGPTTGAIGASGETWFIFANGNFSQSTAGPDSYLAHIWNGSAIQGTEVSVVSGAASANVNAFVFAIVPLSGATTFTLRVKDTSSVNGVLNVAGTSISAVRLS